jgi:hypothetical protein
MADQDLVKQISDQLGRIFRHMLPGLSIICLARASHPSWFEDKLTASPWDLAVFATIAVLAGNTWYVFHRYSVHQMIDWLIYCWKRKSIRGYTSWLANHIYKSFQLKKKNQELHEHISFRSAQIIFIFITSEVALLFSWHAQNGTFLPEACSNNCGRCNFWARRWHRAICHIGQSRCLKCRAIC